MAMLTLETEPPNSSVNASSILFALFKHKWKIILCTLVGLVAAAGVYFFYPPIYESQAKLLVRYVLERSAVDATDGANAVAAAAANKSMDSVINAEVEILTSWDLATQVAEALGPQRLLPGVEKATVGEAAGVVSSGLTVVSGRGSNIIFVSYRNPNPALTTVVLDELISRYFIKHLEVHRSAGAFDFVTQQTDQVRTRLNQTEDALRPLLERAGIASIKESRTNLINELTKTEERLRTAEAELAEQQARVNQMVGGEQPGESTTAAGDHPATASESPGPVVEVVQIPKEKIQDYQTLTLRLEKLRTTEAALLGKYTPKSQRVRVNQRQIQDLEAEKTELEKKYPDIATKAATVATTAGGSSQGKLDIVTERARVAGFQAKVDTLKARYQDIQAKLKQLSELGPQIEELERKRDLEESNYKYFSASLEKARIDEALDPSKMPNISAVQKPSPPGRVTKARNKMALAMAGGGAGLGIALALFSGLFVNRTVRRPLELETQLNIPLMLSIPYSGTLNGHPALPFNGSSTNGTLTTRPQNAKLAPWEPGHFIRPYCEAIRDRLGLYFELNHLTHKPKLVGVAGFSDQSGASTLAAGLAASLSETNDGKVLLVDINLGPEDVHPFFKGKPAYSLTAALKPNGGIASAADNLYLATVGGSPAAGPAQLGLKKFFDMMPNLKASDFDYIIFDMPPLDQTSPTWGMAAFMDKLLLVVEAEKNNRDVIKRSYRKLVAERDNVAVVVNKARSYVPKWLDTDS